MIGMKVCTKCNIAQSIDNYYVIKSRSARNPVCKSCISVANKEKQLNSKYKDTRGGKAVLRIVEILKARHGIKLCKRCFADKPLAAFCNKKSSFDGLHYYCRACDLEIGRTVQANNRSYYRTKDRERYASDPGTSKAHQKRYRDKNKERLNQYQKEYRENSPGAAIALRIRTRIASALRRQSARKHSGLTDVLGCSIEQLREHLERQFKPSMTWDNRNLWHIDHIIPCASFDLTDAEQQKLCFHYSNLQPLWAADNLQKSDRIETPVQMTLPI